MNIHTPTPSLLPHVCSKCGGRDSDPTWHFMAHPADVSPRRSASPLDDINAEVDRAERAVARRTDPSTSWEAARSVTGIRESQAEVLQVFSTFGRMERDGLTDEEAFARYKTYARGKQSVSGFRTRRSELVAKGLLRDTGERRKGSTGRQMIVWATA